ncbi:putative membrane protein YdjX (TVP38/TMEM64 family) [Rhodovulum bhavnagarense]|uniref:TVP38/TMEM64 family membrane protein n=1 Tax=Rhodovulum bhavnagarense TaxID=992286 RepID=A0A4R2RD62_9RHOB|nr:VTT domain-containing protein [Rhodovulum bhavnagarense]TCP60414.1 putative membrane protein YdjX (TVP38/TMEM64 family) [Rhodovulum bhavnagarense]
MDDTRRHDGSGIWQRLPLIVILAVALFGTIMLRERLSFEALAENRAILLAFRDANYGGAVLGFVLAYVVIVAFSLPGAMVATLTGGFLFGVFPGVLYNVTAASLGAVVIFLAARWGLGARLSARIDAGEGRIRRLREGLRANELSVLFVIRLVPVVPFFVANLLPALVGVSLGRFAFTTFFGIMPGALVYTWVGAGLGEVLARGARPDLGLIFEPRILGPLLALAALAALPILVRAIRQER